MRLKEIWEEMEKERDTQIEEEKEIKIIYSRN